MNKTVLWTIIIYTIVLFLVGYMYFQSDSTYKEKIEQIDEKYKLKYDSLNQDIINYKEKIADLDSINKEISSNIDSIKNKQNDNEKPHYTPFYSLSSDSVANIFAGYDLSKRYE